jgi:carboxymethylenebutenolidase
MNRDQMVESWDRHTAYEFALKDANLAVSTMVDDAIVMHLPTMSGGFGKENLRHYYADVFIPGIPADTTSELIARSVGDSLLVDEFIMRMTHDQDIPFLLPGLAPTDKTVEVPTVVIVKFRGNLMESERLYWDQATLLSQLGLIDSSLPFADVTEIGGFLRDKRSCSDSPDRRSGTATRRDAHEGRQKGQGVKLDNRVLRGVDPRTVRRPDSVSSVRRVQDLQRCFAEHRLVRGGKAAEVAESPAVRD